jgi:hypothetical protein
MPNGEQDPSNSADISLVAAGLTLISMTAPMSVHLHFNFQDRLAYLTSKDGSIATAIFQTSCRIGYALGLAVATLIQENVESHALRGGAGSKEALAKGLSAGFWFCAGCAGSCKFTRSAEISGSHCSRASDPVWNAWLADVERDEAGRRGVSRVRRFNRGSKSECLSLRRSGNDMYTYNHDQNKGRRLFSYLVVVSDHTERFVRFHSISCYLEPRKSQPCRDASLS